MKYRTVTTGTAGSVDVSFVAFVPLIRRHDVRNSFAFSSPKPSRGVCQAWQKDLTGVSARKIGSTCGCAQSVLWLLRSSCFMAHPIKGFASMLIARCANRRLANRTDPVQFSAAKGSGGLRASPSFSLLCTQRNISASPHPRSVSLSLSIHRQPVGVKAEGDVC